MQPIKIPSDIREHPRANNCDAVSVTGGDVVIEGGEGECRGWISTYGKYVLRKRFEREAGNEYRELLVRAG